MSVFTTCLDCGAWSLDAIWSCSCCGGDRLDELPVHADSRGAIDNAWAEDRIDDHTYELALEALQSAAAEVNAEAAEANKGYLPLQVVVITAGDANAFVGDHHRHHKPVRFWRWCLGVIDVCGFLRGVAIVGNPKSRVIQSREPGTLEVVRLATDGSRNAASMLYGACFRYARKRGYTKLITYILASEPGTTLRAAGWTLEHFTRGKSWSSKSRPRVDQAPTCNKTRWSRTAA